MYPSKDTEYAQTFVARYGKDTYTDCTNLACEMSEYVIELFLKGLGEEEPGMFFFQTPETQCKILQEACEIIGECDAEAATLCTTVLTRVFDEIESLDEHSSAALCKLICQLACCRQSAEVLRDSRAPELVLQSLRAFQASAAVQSHGCWALYWLAGGTTPWQRWQDHVSDLGALEVLVAALRNRALSAEVQAAACAGLGNLVFKHPANQAQLVQLDGIELLLLALQSHSSNQSVLASCSFWMLNMASASADHATSLADLGATTTLVSVLTEQHKHCPIATNLCLVVQALAPCPGVAQQLVDDRAVEAIVLAMNTHCGCRHLGSRGGSAALLREGCRALLALAEEPRNVEIMKTDELRIVLDVVLRNFAHKDAQIDAAAKSLHRALI
eukprot:TRINITY_DN3234_c0_g1_i2.p1 TRINITY_DN3234_c0_g1~~TRINITY_DN3234_c0_g1_i2.p1  ORF type:complete len:387 (+),score=111.26 TRINITY_DN3234_c0_g1_i2:248-1408(+)